MMYWLTNFARQYVINLLHSAGVNLPILLVHPDVLAAYHLGRILTAE